MPLVLVRDDRGQILALKTPDWSIASTLFRRAAPGESLGGSGGPPVTPDEPVSAPPGQADEPEEAYAGPPRLLPAGVYWHSQGYDPCKRPECAMPRAAVVAGEASSVRAALRRAHRSETLALAAGYPLLAHTDELGAPASTRPGVMVVLGLFETRGEAQAFHRALPARVEPRVISVSDPHRADPYGSQPLRQVIRIDRRGARAYSAAAVERIEELGDTPGARRAIARLRPLCTLRAGQAFVAESQPAIRKTVDGGWIRVRCGARPAYVRITDSLFASAVLSEPSGAATLMQVVGVEHDMADIESWRYTGRGREQ
jgi:hypothetical protein